MTDVDPDVRCQMIRVTPQKPHVFVPYLPTSTARQAPEAERAQRLK